MILIVFAPSHIEVSDGLVGHSVSTFVGLQHLLEVVIEIPLPTEIGELS